ncbi:MAG: hypothetical protein GWM98_09060, partial [Nitrospinaceae bacterium]|nr:hypothetical protein [Nitrospinaceae bacterium]NIR54611.1 hypothetical protein [Nitrospinaceae bacterium]NIT81844.1 hypothetical protein [Nitrospinaceae bacterium]NIW05703.1 hypothetical protein [Nitrospinaceae bacterium]NIX34246.1 hypothetical protein [Nitrospinaceae bacterium]
FNDLVNLGVEGLTQLVGIGPKKAEALFEFAQDYLREMGAAAGVAEEETVGEVPDAEAAGPEEERMKEGSSEEVLEGEEE